MEEISKKISRIYGNPPTTTTLLVNKPNFSGMTEYINNTLLGRASELDNIEPHTQSYLRHLSTITKSIPDNATPIPLENTPNKLKYRGNPHIYYYLM